MDRILRPAFAFFLLATVWPAAAAEPESPERVARETVQTIVDEMEGRRDELRNNPEQLNALIRRVLVPLVDIDHMSRLVLDRHWRDAGEAQRKRFQEAFTQMLIQTYGDALLEFEKGQIEFLPLHAEEGAEDVTFHAQVDTGAGDKIRVAFNLHRVNGEWKIYNGSVGNLTFVTNYRGQFNQEIRRSGLESLIDKLESRYGLE